MSRRDAGRTVSFAAEPQPAEPAAIHLSTRLYDALAVGFDDLAAAADVTAVMQRSLQLLCRTLGQPNGRVAFSADAHTEAALAWYHAPESGAGPALPPDLPEGSALHRARRPLVFSDVSRHHVFRQSLHAVASASLVLVPIIVDDRVTATFTAYGPARSLHFSLLRPLELFAAAVGCLNSLRRVQAHAARLEAAVQQSRRHLHTVTGITTLIADPRIDTVPSQLFSIRTRLLLVDQLGSDELVGLRQEMAALAYGLEMLYQITRRVNELTHRPAHMAADEREEAASWSI